MTSDSERREIANGLRKLADGRHNTGVPDSEILDVLEISHADMPNCSDAYDVEILADLIDRPTGRDLVKHKEDPFVPGKQMVGGFFKCLNCGWDGRIWKNVGFGDMLAYEAKYCPKCGLELEK